MTTHCLTSAAVAYIQQKNPNFVPQWGLVLGSGLNSIADGIQKVASIPYAELPGFGTSHVQGHKGQLILGYLEKIPVACLQGRAHYYEGTSPAQLKTMVRTLKKLGCHSLLLTNAAGSLQTEITPGSVVLITDHINFQGNNPLIGPNDDAFGPRFVGLDVAYDPIYREKLLKLASQENIHLQQGVYLAVAGPVFETPAEIRAYKILGANLVGMSTVPEVIVARHCGLRVVAMSIVSNLAAGLSTVNISHELTLQGAKLAQEKITTLISAFFKNE